VGCLGWKGTVIFFHARPQTRNSRSRCSAADAAHANIDTHHDRHLNHVIPCVIRIDRSLNIGATVVRRMSSDGGVVAGR